LRRKRKGWDRWTKRPKEFSLLLTMGEGSEGKKKGGQRSVEERAQNVTTYHLVGSLMIPRMEEPTGWSQLEGGPTPKEIKTGTTITEGEAAVRQGASWEKMLQYTCKEMEYTGTKGPTR